MITISTVELNTVRNFLKYATEIPQIGIIFPEVIPFAVKLYICYFLMHNKNEERL